MDYKIFVTLIYMVVAHSFDCTAVITMEILNSTKPLKGSRTDNLTVIDATDKMDLAFMCSANYPIELIYNYTGKYFWTEIYVRKLKQQDGANTILEHVANPGAPYTFQAVLSLDIPKQRNAVGEDGLEIVCGSVANHSDYIVINLYPAKDNGAELHITTTRPGAADMIYPKTEVEETSLQVNTKETCSSNVTLIVAQIGSRTYLKCDTTSTNAIAQVDRFCTFVAACTKKYYRNTNKMVMTEPMCVKELAGPMFSQLIKDIRTSGSGWEDVSHTVDMLSNNLFAECKLPTMADDNNLAPAPVEISFDGKRVVGGKIVRQIRFGSRFGIPAENVIWLERPITRQMWYTNDSIRTDCIVPLYWFARDPVVIVTFNWTHVVHEAKMRTKGGDVIRSFSRGKMRLTFTEAGVYQIQCLAPIWNTTGWANYTTTLHVRDATPPEFAETEVSVQFQEGDVTRQLVCDAQGDPAPTIFTWDAGQTTGIEIETSGYGNVATFSNISFSADFENFTIVCTATNKFGQQAAKHFHINLRLNKGERDMEIWMSTSSIVAIATAFACLSFLGIVVMYFKFRKLWTIAASLTPEEVKEFRDGNGRSSVDEDLAIECLPYNPEFDIPKQDFVVDFNSILGSGAYGIVYKGCIRKNVYVAVKTVPCNVPIDYFKALLSELKILAYIGPHDNIVNLIGAYTENIKNRELYVGVELCDKSLLQYLRDNQHTFLNKHGSSYQNGVAIEDSWTFSTLDLIRWSGQIANGMEYLSEKRIVHGDLAARNVLLCFDRNVKICDFGLARQLIDYNYIKTKQCPLPWKWMAIESLTNMKFSTMSDVWAYGVTLWEIFSLGRVPYAGMAWNVDFVNQLKAGLRMTKPTCADYKIFGRMTDCWNPDPKARPSFQVLMNFFTDLETESGNGKPSMGLGGYLVPCAVVE